MILGGGWAVWKQSGGKELGQAVRAALEPVPSERLEVCVTKEGVPGCHQEQLYTRALMFSEDFCEASSCSSSSLKAASVSKILER